LLVSESLKRAGFAHGFSTREGGVSEPPFDRLDFAILRRGGPRDHESREDQQSG